VPPDLFRRAADAGLFRQLICAELGGPGRIAVEWFRTGVEMARWEPSFSWVAPQAAAAHVAGDPAFTPDRCCGITRLTSRRECRTAGWDTRPQRRRAAPAA
jgi:hypothetical protein